MASVAASYWFLQQQKTHYDESLGELIQAKNKLKNARQKSFWLTRYEPKFNQLKQKNIIGDGDRLGWIEAIDEIAQQEKIPYLKFTLNKIQASTFDFYQQETNNLSLFKTIMELDFSLLHEGDLFSLLSSLEHKTQGLFLVDSCSLVNQVVDEQELFQAINYNQERQDIRKDVYHHNIDGKCFLSWYTLHEIEEFYDPTPPPPP